MAPSSIVYIARHLEAEVAGVVQVLQGRQGPREELHISAPFMQWFLG